MSEELECVLCLKLFYEPVTTPCGHTFCRTCLFRALDHNQGCPLCRSPVVLLPDHPVTITIQKVLEKYFPEEFKKRKEEIQEEVVFDTASLPLFPLKHVAFPDMVFPLHIFEPKYRLMIRRCMAGSKCFGLVNVRRNMSETSWIPYDIGCLVSISSIQTLIDGRSFVQCKGTRRFRVLEKWEQDGYLMGKVQWIEEQQIQPHERLEFEVTTREARTLVNQLLSGERVFRNSATELQSLLAQAGDIPDNDLEFSFWLSRFLPLTPDTRQSLLETTSTLDRFRVLVMLFNETTVSALQLHTTRAFEQEENEDMVDAKLPFFDASSANMQTEPMRINRPMARRTSRTSRSPMLSHQPQLSLPHSQPLTTVAPPPSANIAAQTTSNPNWRWF